MKTSDFRRWHRGCVRSAGSRLMRPKLSAEVRPWPKNGRRLRVPVAARRILFALCNN
jgi:hypothetical protein